MSTLSSVVSNLVRAQMGASVSNSVADDDLDRHVAELILKEAKQKLEKYNKDGIRAYLPQQESNAPKTNKRFLSSIIRNTDDHNKTILRAQALAAQEVRQERLEQEKRERKARAEEAVEAERMRRLMGRGRIEWSRDWDRGESRERDRDRDRNRRRRERSWERRDDEGSSRSSHKGKERADNEEREERRSRRHRSRSPAADKSDSRRRHRRERDDSRSRSPDRSTDNSHDRRKDRREHRRSHHHRSRRSRSPGYSDTDRDDRSHRRRHRHHRSRSPDKSRKDTPEAEPEEGYSKPTSSTGDDNLEDDERGRSGQHDIIQGELDSGSPRPHSPAQTPQKRKRSPSPLVGPPSPPKTNDSEESASREDILRRRLKSRLDADIEAGPSTSSRPSRASSPGYSRASSSKPKEVVASTSSSSHTHQSTRQTSPSPGPQPTPPHATTSSKRTRPRSRTRTKVKDAPPQPPSAPPPLPAHLPSKMDKYFEEAYDPRLDVAPLAVPSIPSTGLISDVEFAGWDAMLEVIRQRREDKEDKKRMERLGISDKGKEKDKKKKGAEGTSEAVDIMSIQYKKRGAVREWDLGKEGF